MALIKCSLAHREHTPCYNLEVHLLCCNNVMGDGDYFYLKIICMDLCYTTDFAKEEKGS